jgi:hypothetical protein
VRTGVLHFVLRDPYMRDRSTISRGDPHLIRDQDFLTRNPVYPLDLSHMFPIQSMKRGDQSHQPGLFPHKGGWGARKEKDMCMIHDLNVLRPHNLSRFLPVIASNVSPRFPRIMLP